MKILFEKSKIHAAIKKVLHTHDDVCCAVAFWGEGAKDLLFEPSANARIICDVESGATNPTELKRLLQTKNSKFQIKSVRELHAKVYIGKTAAVIGSANASANGLGEEGKEMSGTIEAIVHLTAPSDVANCRTWFDDLWNNKLLARPILLSDLQEDGKIWKNWLKRRHNRPGGHTKGESKDLFEAFKANPEEFIDRNIYLFAFEEDLSTEASKALGDHEKQLTEIGGRPPALYAYENWTGLKAGMVGVDIDVINFKKPQCRGPFEILPIPLKAKKMRIDLAHKVASIDGYTLKPASKKKLALLVRDNWKALDKSYQNQAIPLSALAEYL